MSQKMEISFAEKELQCPICLGLPEKAVESDCCHQLFCESCIEQVNSCPTCRHRPLRVQPSIITRRLIGRMPIECEFCNAKVERASREAHAALCEKRPLKCTAPNCQFQSADREAFTMHLANTHRDQLLRNYTRLFTEECAHPSTSLSVETHESTRPEPPADQHSDEQSSGRMVPLLLEAARPSAALQEGHHRAGAQVTQNRRGDRVWIGTTGKYYCGKRALDCRCCDGHCGPTTGCNCSACMQLDVSTRRLLPGQLVNNEGHVSRRAANGHFYCGLWLRNAVGRDSYANPLAKCSSERPDWGQCESCRPLDGRRYSSVHADGEPYNVPPSTRRRY